MDSISLIPILKDFIWGGNRLVNEYHILSSLPRIAEAWLLSPSPETSVIADGELAGKDISALLSSGEKLEEEFPLLIKLIDAKEALSIQVHPDDAYAKKMHLTRGKTEMWYVLDAKPDSYIYYGFSTPVDEETLREKIDDGSILDVLQKTEVHKGDVYYIPSGTLHAIGPGIVIAEVQQNSTITYRVFDFDRVDEDGNTRELHVDDALAVLKPICMPTHSRPKIVEENEKFQLHELVTCDYFDVYRYIVATKAEIPGNEDCWRAVLVTEGEGNLYTKKNGPRSGRNLVKGELVLLPKSNEEFILDGQVEALLVK
ncbi:MAG TPA: class I mannose-6-phosphate isomerase [Bacillota bacterium]|nr:class I mannose-6-phosphate isomerase [Bacillota bacterium]HPE38009.1 class I mannose-6-phosphate isomerase [Bacillota bacterium]